jgi:enediyne biosynthesis protein E4
MNIDFIKKLTVILFFAALLGTPYMMKQLDIRSSETVTGSEMESALERYGFFLEEVSEEAGIQFTHQSPKLDERLEHILPQVASIGASVSVADVNSDGYHDIYLTNSRYDTKNALYKNNGDGTFTNIAPEMGIADLNKEGSGVSMGAIWGDFNNSGYEDLFLYKWGKPELFRNDDGKGFTRITAEAGLPDWINANTAVWLDYDGDGSLDLFIGGYYDESINLWELESTKIMPDSYEYATNGGRNYLFKNNGDGTFTDVTEETGLTSRRWTLAAATADLTGSGFSDLVIANDYGVDEFFVNENGSFFRSAGETAGIGFAPKSGMSVAFGDILNQGVFSMYITNISEPGVLIQGNNLWVPSKMSDDVPVFSNLAGNFGVELGGWSYGGQFGDLNNSGYQDLYVANGYVSAEMGTDYWYDFSKVAGGNKAIIQDAKNWPAMSGRSLSGFQQNRIWLNDGAGRFREVSSNVGGFLDLDSRSVAFADLNNNGNLDIIVATQNNEVKVYRNHTAPDHNWISFDLKGTESNQSAIGAIVELHWNGNRQAQVVSGGNAFSSQNQRPLHFGLGKNAEVEKAVIRWPSGMEQVIDKPEISRMHRITEPEGN